LVVSKAGFSWDSELVLVPGLGSIEALLGDGHVVGWSSRKGSPIMSVWGDKSDYQQN
jgi:hypothetical protein